jgi:phosphosulfolactate phosphohydrolase-like enzyme
MKTRGQMRHVACDGLREISIHVLVSCSSGRELVERGFLEDVQLAAQLDAEILAPELIDGAFVASALRGSHA